MTLKGLQSIDNDMRQRNLQMLKSMSHAKQQSS